MQIGKQSWKFTSTPAILTTGVVGGPYEKNGNLAQDFDKLYDSRWLNEKSYEQAHRHLIEDALTIALKKINKNYNDIDFFLAGDLINQMTPTNFSARTNQIPFIGLFNACATIASGLAFSALLIDSKAATYVATGASSHHGAVERQFRYPTSYGAQKHETSQWTVTGAGMAVIGVNKKKQNLPVITGATIGKVIDCGCTNPQDMGSAMAPAAYETIAAHFKDFSCSPCDFDLILTGDLGKIGSQITYELLERNRINTPKNRWNDCGMLIYNKKQPVFSGGSGAGCSATVLLGHIYRLMQRKKLKRILFCATGALLSPLSFQQKESIPCIAHAIALEINNEEI